VKVIFTAALACFSLTGCLGYHIGPVKPYYLRDVHTIAVPTFKNRTLLPHIEVLVTDTVIKQLQQDGTFQIAKGEDAVEFNLAMSVRYTVIGRDGTQLVGSAEATGTTTFFVSSDPATDERQALPLATENLATQLVSQLSEGW